MLGATSDVASYIPTPTLFVRNMLLPCCVVRLDVPNPMNIADLKYGDIIAVRPLNLNSQPRLAVVIEVGDYPKAVFLHIEDVEPLIRNSGYSHNRCWFLSGYDLELISNPTDEQIATAALILMTGYVPGVDP